MPSGEVVNVGCNLKNGKFLKYTHTLPSTPPTQKKSFQYLLHVSVVYNQASDTLYLKLFSFTLQAQLSAFLKYGSCNLNRSLEPVKHPRLLKISQSHLDSPMLT
jgi:hypothetical protein